MSEAHTIAWRAHLLTYGARSALLCPSTASFGEEGALLGAIARDLIARAGQRADLSVRSIKVSSKQLDAADLAAELGADYTIELEAQTAEQRLTLAFSATPRSRDLPAHRERFEAPTTERIRFLDDTAAHVLEDLRALLDERVLQGMREWGTKNLHAYRHASTAGAFQANLDFASLERVAKELRHALAHDPAMESAYLELCAASVDMAGLATEAATRERIRAELQEMTRDAHRYGVRQELLERLRHSSAFLSKSSPFELEVLWRHDLRTNPTDAEGLGGYAQLLCGAGLFPECERYLDQAIRFEGPSPNGGWKLEQSTLAGNRGDLEEHVRLLKRDLETHHSSTLHLSGLIRFLALLRRFTEADGYLARLQATDPAWGFSVKLALRLIRGDLVPGGESFEKIVASPAAMNINRGMICFIAGDVERGVRFWREIEPVFAPLLWRFAPQMANAWAPGVIVDPSYQAMLNDLGIGQRWKRYLWERTQELSEVTGIPVTSPRPTERLGPSRRESPALDLLPYALIGLDEQGRVAFTNAAADRLLSARRGLKTIGARLVAGDPAASALLRDAIDRAIAAALSGRKSAAELLRCPRIPPARALQLLVSPGVSSDAPHVAGAEPRSAALVIASDPDAAPLPAAEALQSLFELTPALARLAAAVAAGQTVAEYAEDHGVTEGTARQQLKELMARVGVRRQAELVRVLLSGVAQLRVEAGA